MSDEKRRWDDSMLGRITRYWREIAAVAALIGAAYVTKADVQTAKISIRELQVTTVDHEKRLIRIEEAIRSIAEIKDDVREIRRVFSGRRGQ